METRFLNNNDQTYAIQRTQDVEPVIEFAKARRAAGDVGSKDMKLAAEFPAVIIENYINRAGITFAEFMRDQVHVKRMLADPDLKHFRIWEGRA